MTIKTPKKPRPRQTAKHSKASKSRQDEQQREQLRIGGGSVPPALNDPKRRKVWELPEDETQLGDYMLELNVAHSSGMMGAEEVFLNLYTTVVDQEQLLPQPDRRPVKVGRNYFKCRLSVSQWRRLIQLDETDQQTKVRRGSKERAIYRIWPDFPLQPQILTSIATVKADAAQRSYDASGSDIVWAVIDSGICANHPHFGSHLGAGHTLCDAAVINLHRDFSDSTLDGFDPENLPPSSPQSALAERDRRIAMHRAGALTDELGHGTHVAGIIAGGLAGDDSSNIAARVFERSFGLDELDRRTPTAIAERKLWPRDRASLRGVAPQCLLISLKVLDENGRGRVSNIIRALDYISTNLNGNPKQLLVHGVNLSVGYEFDAEMFACGQSPICVEVDRLVQSGVIVVAAAGNTGYGTALAQNRPNTRVGISNSINDPGNANLAITVGSTHRDAPYTYGVSYISSKGPTSDGRLKPDLVAPGERVTSCAAGKNVQFIRDRTKRAGLAELSDDPGPALALRSGTVTTEATQGDAPPRTAVYIDDSGTSLAAPHVSGAIASFLSIRREFIGKPTDVKRIFLASASSLGRERYFEGHGLVDLMRAIQSI